MMSAHVHEAVLHLPVDGDAAAAGAAITAALCGHWEHEPPCPLAPHYTSTRRAGNELLLRVLFVSEQEREQEVRDRIVAALAAGTGPLLDGGLQAWRLIGHQRAAIAADEMDHVLRLRAASGE